jgi:hypothetical protein
MCNNTFTENSNFHYLVKGKHVTMKKLLVLVLAVRLQRSWTLLFGVIYKKIADLLLR